MEDLVTRVQQKAPLVQVVYRNCSVLGRRSPPAPGTPYDRPDDLCF